MREKEVYRTTLGGGSRSRTPSFRRLAISICFSRSLRAKKKITTTTTKDVVVSRTKIRNKEDGWKEGVEEGKTHRTCDSN